MSEKKTAIIQGAINALTNKQVHELSMEDIAKHARVSVGTIYNYFKSKDELIEALYVSRESEFIQQVHDISRDNTVLGFDKLHALLGKLLTFFADNTAVAKIWLAYWHASQPKKLPYVERGKIRNVLSECIIVEYGEDVRAYLPDIQILVEGMLISVASKMYIDDYTSDKAISSRYFDTVHVARRLTHTIRSICDSMVQSDIPPIFIEDQYEHQSQQRMVEKLLQIIERIAVSVDEAEIPMEKKESLHNIILFIRSECSNEQPRIFLIVPLLKELMLYKHLLHEDEGTRELEQLLQSK